MNGKPSQKICPGRPWEDTMTQDEDEAKRTIWAQGAAKVIIDEVLAARYSAEDEGRSIL
jgi:hypothetical protein